MAGSEDEDVEVSVVDDPGGERYVVRVGDRAAGFVRYRRAPDRTVFTHTEVDGRFERRGLGSALVRAALDAERAQGHTVEPRCPFVAHFIRGHPDYADLVPETFRGQLEH
jgi:predicted GNAT family acetyltransferase